MSSIITAMKNKVAYKVNQLVSDPEAEEFAKEAADRKKKEEERLAKEKASAERLARQKAKSKKETEKLLKSDPGVDKIEQIYTKQNLDGEDEEYVDVSWKPYADGRKDANYTVKKVEFDALVNTVDPEFLKQLYADYEKRQKQAEERQEKANFSTKRMAKHTWETFWSIFRKVIGILLGILAASLAVNLNLYKHWPYRVLYAVFAYFYWYLVIPYVFLYRWFWLGKQPKFYSLLPLVPLRFENRYMAQFYSWLSYKPDDEIESQKEWLTWKKEHDKQ